MIARVLRPTRVTPHLIHVIATTEEGTRAALLEANQRFAPDAPGRILLLVAQVASYRPLTVPSREDTPGVDAYRDLALRAGVDAKVRLCVGRRLPDIFNSILRRDSVVLVGGRRRWWWPTAEQRIARHLRKNGYQVVFVDAAGPDAAGVLRS